MLRHCADPPQPAIIIKRQQQQQQYQKQHNNRKSNNKPQQLSRSLSPQRPLTWLTLHQCEWLLCFCCGWVRLHSKHCLSFSLLFSQWVKGERQLAKLLFFCFGLRVVHFGDMGGIFPPSRGPHILALSIYVALSPQRLRHFFAQLEMAAGRESETKKIIINIKYLCK